MPTLGLEGNYDFSKYLHPKGHSGVHALHKYWGKKPADVMGFLVEHLSEENDVVADPFLGYGSLAYEAAISNRRFVGVDINPIAVAISRFLVFPPSWVALSEAVDNVMKDCREKINSSYQTENGEIASHYLWEGGKLHSVWVRNAGKPRIEKFPTKIDFLKSEQYAGYTFAYPRELQLYDNSRISTKENTCWHDIFTGRAMNNIDLLMESIKKQDVSVQMPLLLILTSALGQMSKMVFAIKRRGKYSENAVNAKIEVGSWVIGYWCPNMHFEVNAWNCFYRRAQRALRAIKANSRRATIVDGSLWDVINGDAEVSIECMDAEQFIVDALPDSSVDLIVTDPPHGDRIPYLELSEMWNAALNFEVNWESELVVSNANTRKKDVSQYIHKMDRITEAYDRVLSQNGVLGLIFNTRNGDIWSALLGSLRKSGLTSIGYLPVHYSATSVIQDNRRGALPNDYVLLFGRQESRRFKNALDFLSNLPNWRSGSFLHSGVYHDFA